jgi:hypothetical protein
MYFPSRPITCKLIEYAEEGLLNWESIARAALCYLSEAQVSDMAHINELFIEDEDEEEEELDPMDDYNYVGSRHHY